MTSILLNTFLLILSIQLFFFFLAFFLKTDKFTDITYSLTFFLVTLLKLTSLPSPSLSQIILSLLILLWAARLGSYLLIRIFKIKRDNRFQDIRPNFFKFLGFWLLQAITIWAVLLPTNLFLSSTTDNNINTISLFAIPLIVFALVYETIADYQKFIFKLKPQNKNKFISTGLWRHSRHPNYFAEILFWWSVFLYISSYLSGLEYLTILGPIFIHFMLLFVSGIPLLDKRYNLIYKDNPDYQLYKSQTSLLLPLPKLKN